MSCMTRRAKHRKINLVTGIERIVLDQEFVVGQFVNLLALLFADAPVIDHHNGYLNKVGGARLADLKAVPGFGYHTDMTKMAQEG